MPSTDIDGSPVLIIGREHGEVVARLLHDRSLERPLTPAELRLAGRIQEAFGIEV